jgi:hypothetical protein
VHLERRGEDAEDHPRRRCRFAVVALIAARSVLAISLTRSAFLMNQSAMKWNVCCLCLVASFGWASVASANSTVIDPRAVVNAALDRMNAGTNPRSLRSLKIEEQDIAYDIVENDHPGPPYYASVTEVSRVEDLGGRRELVETHSSDGSIVQKTLLTRGQWISGAGTDKAVAERAAPSWETQNPVRALELAAAAPDLRTEPGEVFDQSPQRVVSFTNGRYRVKLLIDIATGLLSASEAVVAFDRPMSQDVAFTAWGDVDERTEFVHWTFKGGIRYPFQSDIFRSGVHYRSLLAKDVTVPDGKLDLDAEFPKRVPEQIASVDDIPLGASVAFAPNPGKAISEIAPGIIQVPNSWYTTLVRQDDGIVIIDAPISAGYSKNVIAEARRRFSGLPIKALVTSTAFFWHVAGIREYAALGIPIYAEQRNAGTLRAILSSVHTLDPDDLSRCRCHPGKIVTVSGRVAIGTGRNRMELMPIGTATEPMLMTYVADAKLLHTGEMVQPLGPGGSILYPESLIELVHAVAANGLGINTMIGMHMSPTPWTEIDRTLKDAGARP